MADPTTVAFWVGSPAVLVGAGVSVRKIVRTTSSFLKRLGALAALAEHELNHNSGTSTKDAAFAAANAAAEAADTARKAVEISQATHDQFTTFLVDHSREQSAIWQAINERKVS